MQISTKFTIAIHVLTAVEYFSKDYKVTSEFLAGSVGSNPVIIRNIMLQLKDAGLIEIKRGPGGIHLLKPLNEITFLDVYKAVETSSHEDLFRFHENPNPQCPAGHNIHDSLDNILHQIQADFEADLARHKVGEVYRKVLKDLGMEK